MRSIFYAGIVCFGLGIVAQAAHAETVTVTVTGIDKAGGKLDVVLYTEGDWLSHTPTIPPQYVTAAPGSMTVSFDNVTPGIYGILAFHDVNMNHDLDKNFIGIPTEQFGFSNDPGYNHEPKFEEVKFTVADQPISVTVKLSD